MSRHRIRGTAAVFARTPQRSLKGRDVSGTSHISCTHRSSTGCHLAGDHRRFARARSGMDCSAVRQCRRYFPSSMRSINVSLLGTRDALSFENRVGARHGALRQAHPTATASCVAARDTPVGSQPISKTTGERAARRSHGLVASHTASARLGCSKSSETSSAAQQRSMPSRRTPVSDLQPQPVPTSRASGYC